MTQPEHREQMREKVWDNPEWRAQSKASLEEVKSRPEVIEFMSEFNHREDHPFKRPEVRAKAQATLARNGWVSYQGGNGTPPTRQEVALSEALGWESRIHVTVGDGERPHHYEIDVADRSSKTGVEIDGRSHSAPDRQRADRRKDARLSAIGWVIHRFTNQQVDEDLPRCVKTILG